MTHPRQTHGSMRLKSNDRSSTEKQEWILDVTVSSQIVSYLLVYTWHTQLHYPHAVNAGCALAGVVPVFIIKSTHLMFKLYITGNGI